MEIISPPEKIDYSSLVKQGDNQVTNAYFDFSRIEKTITIAVKKAFTTASGATRATSVGFIPTEYRPTEDIHFILNDYIDPILSAVTTSVTFKANGQIIYSNSVSTTSWRAFSFTFVKD